MEICVSNSNNKDSLDKPDKIFTFLWSVQGLANKLSIVENYILNWNIDVFCLVEYWLVKIEIDCYGFDGYELSSAYSMPSRKHSGCDIFVKYNISHKSIDSVYCMSVEIVFEVTASYLTDLKTFVLAL